MIRSARSKCEKNPPNGNNSKYEIANKINNKSDSAIVAEPHHFCAASNPDENFDAAPAATAPAPSLLNSKPKFFKGIKVNYHILFATDSV
jgi:hypothetical protein